ncbi:M55 family metallopeptidase [Mesorhizobium sp. ORM6]
MKTFISADIEGTAGITDWDEALKERRDYQEFREVADKVCFLQEGLVYEEGPPSQIFGNPQGERTRAFLKRIIDAGRL